MEKNLYEQYQYLTNNGVDSNLSAEQYIIVQDNALISDNKHIQYVEEIKNDKDVENVACPVYNINSQPYYEIDLNVTHELITPITVNSVIQQAIVPSTVYANNYMLQNSTLQVIQAESDNNIKQISQNAAEIDPNKQFGGYAEITLSDEQYESLKEKGWILLEIKDKVFLLDSSGLHEITNNHNLVNKLRYESQIVPKSNEEPGSSETEPMRSKTEPMEFDNVTVQRTTNTLPNTLQNYTEYREQVKPTAQIQNLTVCGDKAPTKASQKKKYSQQKHDESDTDDQKMSNEARVKTQFLVKDIPKEIVLGKTARGKTLVARMVRGKGFFKRLRKSNKAKKRDLEKERIITDEHLLQLVHQMMHSSPKLCSAEVVLSVNAVVLQLLHVPEYKNTLHEYKLIVTKTIREENEDGGMIQNDGNPMVITGQFVIDGAKKGFVHIPDMLNTELDKFKQNHQNNEENIASENAEESTFLHVNITDSISYENTSRVSVMVKKRLRSGSAPVLPSADNSMIS